LNPTVKIGNEEASETFEEVVIRVEGLRKSYGEVVAIAGLSLTVNRGEVFGILGPKGAGKTTTLETIVGLRKPDAGKIDVAGYDVPREFEDLKRIIGVQPQGTALFDYLTVRENLKLFADLNGADASPARIRRLLDAVSLTERAESRVKDLSEGQQQRLSLALALVNDPKIVFLDEPTTGLDPQVRRDFGGLIRHIRGDDKTVVLTTRYAEEAEEVCDRVAIMDRGRVLISDTPRALVRSLDMDARILASVETEPGEHLDADLDLLPGVMSKERNGKDLWLRTEDAQTTIIGLMQLAVERGMQLRNLSVQSTNLEDVFITYTGSELRE
jgi:ABC-2 type transport system ATP-binding protein